MTKEQVTPPTVKPLTDLQYARWARLARVSESSVRMYHSDTGKAPHPGFRRINTWNDFPGLQQLHAWLELHGAQTEAFVQESRASNKAKEAVLAWQTAKQLHDSLEAAHAAAYAAYKRLAAVESAGAGE